MPYLKNSAIKKLIKEKGFRCKADFIEALDRKVHKLVEDAIVNKETNDPKRKTVSAVDISV